MHALPIKPSRIYYRREKEPEQDFVKHCSPKAGPGAAKPRPASPSKRPTLLTASRVDTDTLQDVLANQTPLEEEYLQPQQEQQQPQQGQQASAGGEQGQAAAREAEAETTPLDVRVAAAIIEAQ